MCELLGMSANTPTDLCFSFTGLTRRGGETGPHKDGWGVAFYEGQRKMQKDQPLANTCFLFSVAPNDLVLQVRAPYSVAFVCCVIGKLERGVRVVSL